MEHYLQDDLPEWETEQDEELLLSELMRNIHLFERECGGVASSGQGVYAIWYLLNSQLFSGRETTFVSDAVLDYGYPQRNLIVMKFTAHTHHEEPFDSSPDDRCLYAAGTESLTRNYIIDRFCCREVGEREWF